MALESPGSQTPAPEAAIVITDGMTADDYVEQRRAQRAPDAVPRRKAGAPAPPVEAKATPDDGSTFEKGPDENQPAPAPAPEGEEATEDAAAAPAPGDGPARRGGKKDPDRRIAIEVRKTKEAEDRNAALQRQIDELNAKLASASTGAPAAGTPPAVPAVEATAPTVTDEAIKARSTDPKDPEPTQDDIGEKFTTYEDWHRAYTKWAVRQANREDRARTALEQEAAQATQARTEVETYRQERETAFQADLTTFRQATPDFDKVVSNPEAVITDTMETAILEMENPSACFYALGLEPAESKRIAALRPIAQVREIARLSSRLAADSTGPAPSAAAVHRPSMTPVQPAGARSTGTAAPLDTITDPDAYVERRRREMAREGARRGR